MIMAVLMAALNLIPRPVWDICTAKYRPKSISADISSTVQAPLLAYADDKFSIQRSADSVCKLISIFNEFHILTGLATDASKTRICEINSDISIDEKNRLKEKGFSYNSFVNSFTFLGHKN